MTEFEGQLLGETQWWPVHRSTTRWGWWLMAIPINGAATLLAYHGSELNIREIK